MPNMRLGHKYPVLQQLHCNVNAGGSPYIRDHSRATGFVLRDLRLDHGDIGGEIKTIRWQAVPRSPTVLPAGLNR